MKTNTEVELEKKFEEMKQKMNNKFESKVEPIVEEIVVPIIYDTKAYTAFQKDGKWSVVEFDVSKDTLDASKGKIVESNTDMYIVKERLHILLMGGDLV